jgi:DNA-binding response OmpR family regulator
MFRRRRRLTKPFNFEILLLKIIDLLLMHQTLKKTYQKQTEIQVQDMDIVSEDKKVFNQYLNGSMKILLEAVAPEP